jgi:hypothetical protein
MTKQQISQDEKKQNFFMEHQKFSKISFIIFVISLAFYLYIKIHFASGGDFFMAFFGSFLYTPYIIYLTLHSLFVAIKYKKILIYNLIAFALLSIIVILNCTGFSYTRGHYLSKAEQIDIGLEGGYLYTICFNEGWEGEKLKDCPYTLEKLKIEYPQCFTDDRPDDCELYQYRYRTRDYIHFEELISGFAPISVIYSEQLAILTDLGSNTYYSVFSGASASYIFGNYSNFFDKNFQTRSEK